MKISVILCTRNNCASLVSTLESFHRLHVDFTGEVLLVDNGSSDGTWEALGRFAHPSLPVRRIREENRGLCYARNRALVEAQGDIVAFTDDDVRVSPEWIHSITRPLLEGRADAVVGGISIASHLMRPWMTGMHRAWLASTEALDPEAPAYLIGANMAFVRSVIQKVPAFDVELDPGRLGAWGDTLFARQLGAAGFRLKGAFDHPIEHHFSAARLSRAAFLRAARIQGRCYAYVQHHWHHEVRQAPRREWLRKVVGLARLRWDRAHAPATEGVAEAELALVAGLSIERQWLIECRRPRNYEKHGLKRLRQ
jgi:glycosyltransferase involved in cell wall biosynthesis